VVVVEQTFARLEMLELDALLRALDRPRDERMREDLALLRSHAVHERGDALGPEETHQVVFERQEELRRAGIALTPRTPAELTIDSARLVSLRPDDVQTAVLDDVDLLPFRIFDLRRLRLGDALTEFDVGAAAGHVRRDRDGGRLSRERDDFRLALVVLRVE